MSGRDELRSTYWEYVDYDDQLRMLKTKEQWAAQEIYKNSLKFHQNEHLNSINSTVINNNQLQQHIFQTFKNINISTANMRTEITSIAVLAGLFAISFATPARLFERQATLVCASGTPQCCDVDVLGIADLDCSTPPTVPTTVDNFTAICADIGKIDMCCDIPILEQGLLCTKPI